MAEEADEGEVWGLAGVELDGVEGVVVEGVEEGGAAGGLAGEEGAAGRGVGGVEDELAAGLEVAEMDESDRKSVV